MQNDTKKSNGFRSDFAWGAATAAYQVEGAAYEGGKGLHIWDVYCKAPGKIYEGHTGDVACDHYHRYKEDVALMKEIGLNAYRFSLSWTRLLPDGTGRVNPEGVAFYNNLINELIANGIEPYISLFHWDYPYELYKRGGWLNPDSVNWFAEYAALVVSLFSDRVTHFITFNEPQCFVGLGYTAAEHAPGLVCVPHDAFLAGHHVMMAHGKAVQAMRAAAKQPIEIGYAPTGTMCYPVSDKPEDIEAARTELFRMNPELPRWFWNVSWWSDPVMLGRFPEDGIAMYEQYLPKGWEKDLELMHQPVDFYGQNIYNGWGIQAGADGSPAYFDRYQGFPRTAVKWPVTPECLYWGPKFLQERYGKPIYITENGISCHDVISVDGKVHDPNRIDFLYRYLRELRRAAADGVDIRGYFQWTLLDNFEWEKGYTERFGMVYVDFRDQRRILKDSAHWYRTVIESNGGVLK
ncbi:MAG: beta-glucosidase [Lachnospiraceae bacterium]|nr:beta-glucosidase [Lachnospiraceae bacterium]